MEKEVIFWEEGIPEFKSIIDKSILIEYDHPDRRDIVTCMFSENDEKRFRNVFSSLRYIHYSVLD